MKMTINKKKYGENLIAVGIFFANKGWVYLILLGGLYVLYKAIFRTSTPVFLAFSLLTLAFFFFLLIINNLKSILCYSVSSVVSFDTLIFILKMFHSQEY